MLEESAALLTELRWEDQQWAADVAERVGPVIGALFAGIWHWGDRQGSYVIGHLRSGVEAQRGQRARHVAPRYRKQPISPKLRVAVFKRDGFECVYCGETKNLAADHIVPESRGGAATMDNLQTLCRKCNSLKGANGPDGDS